MNPEPSPASGSNDYLSRLNEAQRQAVTHGTGVSLGGADSSPLLVIAGAGSGKTNTLAHRVAHLIASGADPRRILLLTLFPAGQRRDDATGEADLSSARAGYDG
ncbi:UvrD-helicase domain-containing protein [Gluconobacter vitians]|uniref:UvrD-helicase domain-containing protein n=1 Tax=Gluconobacter vitians TaxID=2728102 RepID=UPI001D174676|nr:UvrD-helicase domain-containing protein [Gluconobacter vitians]